LLTTTCPNKENSSVHDAATAAAIAPVPSPSRNNHRDPQQQPKTPSYRHPYSTSAAATGGRPRIAPHPTTPGSTASKVLRDALESATKPNRHPHLQAGAMRLDRDGVLWNRSDGGGVAAVGVGGGGGTLHYRTRIGYDGSYQTPSKELLRSTNASRHQRTTGPTPRRTSYSPLDEEEAEDDEIMADVDALGCAVEDMALDQASFNLTGQRRRRLRRQRNCANPVARTLMMRNNSSGGNMGREDWEMLNDRESEEDFTRSTTAGSFDNGAGDDRECGNQQELLDVSTYSNESGKTPPAAVVATAAVPPAPLGLLPTQQQDTKGSDQRNHNVRLARPLPLYSRPQPEHHDHRRPAARNSNNH